RRARPSGGRPAADPPARRPRSASRASLFRTAARGLWLCRYACARRARLPAMCGVVGYVGPNVDGTALDVVMEGLARLEYRGYDSAGVALVDGGFVATQKRSGK